MAYGMRVEVGRVFVTLVFDNKPSEDHEAHIVNVYRHKLGRTLAEHVGQLIVEVGATAHEPEVHEVPDEEYFVAETWDDGGAERRTSEL